MSFWGKVLEHVFWLDRNLWFLYQWMRFICMKLRNKDVLLLSLAMEVCYQIAIFDLDIKAISLLLQIISTSNIQTKHLQYIFTTKFHSKYFKSKNIFCQKTNKQTNKLKPQKFEIMKKSVASEKGSFLKEH